jgi:peptide methionine sulfoxide reductase MsrA
MNSSGNVGIGTTNPLYKLDVSGQVHTSSGYVFADGSIQTTAYTGTCGGDYAETVDVAGDRKSYEPGDVLVIGAESGSDVLKSAEL